MEEKPEPKETKQLTGDEKASSGLLEKVKEGSTALKTRAIDEAKGYKDIQETQLWKSIFRVSHDRSDPRNRSLSILSNVFLHLHPAKINRDATRYGFTWGMGGITFYLFIVLTFTGVLLMFYYHPQKVLAFRDIRAKAPVHFMLIPKRHIDSLAHAENEATILGKMLALSGRLAREQGSPDGYRAIVNTGRIGRQDVMHLHIHVIGGPSPLGPMMPRSGP